MHPFRCCFSLIETEILSLSWGHTGTSGLRIRRRRELRIGAPGLFPGRTSAKTGRRPQTVVRPATRVAFVATILHTEASSQIVEDRLV